MSRAMLSGYCVVSAEPKLLQDSQGKVAGREAVVAVAGGIAELVVGQYNRITVYEDRAEVE